MKVDWSLLLKVGIAAYAINAQEKLDKGTSAEEAERKKLLLRVAIEAVKKL